MAIITRTSDAASTEPLLVLGYETARESGTVVHEVIGGGIAVTLAPAAPRSGTLQLLYASETAAFAALNLHSAPSVFELSDVDRDPVGMTYVVKGVIALALTDDREHFEVTVGYQEVEV